MYIQFNSSLNIHRFLQTSLILVLKFIFQEQLHPSRPLAAVTPVKSCAVLWMWSTVCAGTKTLRRGSVVSQCTGTLAREKIKAASEFTAVKRDS